MSVLRSIESKLESLFEGVFGRAFRSNVQPVELARKLVKEMDDHRSVSVSRVYVPNEYTVYLSPADREQFADYEDQLCEELGDYLTEHARRERYVLLTTPQVKLETDDDLDVGEFGIATRLVRGPAAAGRRAPRRSPTRAATMIYKAPPLPARADRGRARRTRSPRSRSTGERHELGDRAVVLGRSKDCDIRLSDPNVSRRHAEVRPDGAGYTVVDLDSTNGIEIDGKRVKELALTDGTRFTLGTTEVSFSQRTADLVPLASVGVETTLLVLKIAFLVLLYLFIWRIVRSAARDLRLPQESMILSPQQASALLAQPRRARARPARRRRERARSRRATSTRSTRPR